MQCTRNAKGFEYATVGSCHSCPECGSIDFTVDDERCEIICKNCGTVIDDKFIQFSPSKR